MLRSICLLVAVCAIGSNAMEIIKDAVPPPVEKPAAAVATLDLKPVDAKKPVPPGLKPVGQGFPGQGVPHRPGVLIAAPKPAPAAQRPPVIHVQVKQEPADATPKHEKDHASHEKPRGQNGKGVTARPQVLILAQPAQPSKPHVVQIMKEFKVHNITFQHFQKYEGEFRQHLHVIGAAIKAAKETKDAKKDVCLPIHDLEAVLEAAQVHLVHAVKEFNMPNINIQKLQSEFIQHLLVIENAIKAAKQANKDAREVCVPTADVEPVLRAAQVHFTRVAAKFSFHHFQKFEGEFRQHLRVIGAAIKAAKETKDAKDVCLPIHGLEAVLEAAQVHLAHVVKEVNMPKADDQKLKSEFSQHLLVIENAIKAAKQVNKDAKEVCIPIADVEPVLQAAQVHFTRVAEKFKAPKVNFQNFQKFQAEFNQHLFLIEAAIKAAKETKDAKEVCLPIADVEAILRPAKAHFHRVVSLHDKNNSGSKNLAFPVPEIKVQTKPAAENIVLRPAGPQKPFLDDALPPQGNDAAKPVPVPVVVKPLLIKPKPKPIIQTLPVEVVVDKEAPKVVVAPKPMVVKPVKPIAAKPAEEVHGAEKPVGITIE